MKQYPFSVTVLRSGRKTLAIQVATPGEITVRAPKRLSLQCVEQFLDQHMDWIMTHLAKAEARETQPPLTPAEIETLAREALIDLPARLRRFAPLVGVDYGRVTIRNQRTKWGSCSGKGNLNFNCLLMLCPEEVRDYVAVHELCHRREMNHSPRFWAEVARVLPGYEAQRKWLKTEGQKLIARLPG